MYSDSAIRLFSQSATVDAYIYGSKNETTTSRTDF